MGWTTFWAILSQTHLVTLLSFGTKKLEAREKHTNNLCFTFSCTFIMLKKFLTVAA
jgi:hypothetical protein